MSKNPISPPKKNYRYETIAFVVAPEEKKRMKDSARKRGMTLSTFVRFVVSDYISTHDEGGRG